MNLLKWFEERSDLIEFCIFSVLVILFVYFRLPALANQSVPYTYDQGRDFLQTQELVRTKNIPFVGPTTGINGVFHGAWWYYLLVIPYALFQGNPIGFYYFIFLISSAQSLLFYVFLKKEMGLSAALIFLGLTAISPYFIRASLFTINSFVALPFLLLLFASLLKFFQTERIFYLFLIFLSAGFILEAELAFGIFIIPSLIIAALVTRRARLFFGGARKIAAVFIGVLVALVPRILFEIKNHFLQTRSLVNFSLHSTATHPSTLFGAIQERLRLFWDLYLFVFPSRLHLVAILVFIVSLLTIVVAYKKLEDHLKKYVLYLIAVFILIFGMSIISKNNFFWANYLEGFSFFYVVFIVFASYAMSKLNLAASKLWTVVVLSILLIVGLAQFRAGVSTADEAIEGGLQNQTKVVRYIYDQVGRHKVCVRVYTPPVIPYTYDYLFSYFENHGYSLPSHDYIGDKCYYVIEKDDYPFRVEKWKTEHIPLRAERLSKKMVTRDIVVELWKQIPNQ